MGFFFLMIVLSTSSLAFAEFKPLLGEQTITLKTRDGVKIIGSFFLPTNYLNESKPSSLRILFDEGIWSELEKEYLIVSAPVKKGKVTRIPIIQGDFTYAEEELYPFEKNGEPDKAEEKKESEEKIIEAPYVPLIPLKKNNDPIDSTFSPYESSAEGFKIRFSVNGKKAVSGKKKSGLSKEQGFRLLVEMPTPLLDSSCFHTFTGLKNVRYPGVILLHMWERNRNEWRPLIPFFQDAGIAVLTIDMRGHGESLYKNGRTLKLKKFVTKNYQNMVKDAFAAYQFL